MTGLFIILIILVAIYIGLFYESNHSRHMRRIKECKEDKQTEPSLFNKQERIERKKKYKGSHNIKDYPGSSQYQALLKKYNGSIPGSGQGDRSKGKKPKGRNLGWRYGTKGGKHNERISKKAIDTGNIFK